MRRDVLFLAGMVLILVLGGGCQTNQAYNEGGWNWFGGSAEAQPPPVVDQVDLSVRLFADGRIHLNLEEVALADLGTQIEKTAKALDDAVIHVRIKADGDVTFARIQAVTTACRNAGLVRIALEGL